MKPFRTIRTPEGWYVSVAVGGKLYGRKVELGQPTVETLANSLDGWYRDNGREWLAGEIKKGYLTEIPRSTLIIGNGMKGWQDRQDVLWEKALRDRL